MSLENIVSAIDAEIAKLQQVKQLLGSASPPKEGPGRPRRNAVAAVVPAKRKKRRLSAAARAKIAAAQKARWAKVKRAKAKSVPAKPEAAK